MQSFSRPRLLVVELWGLGDLAIAIPFLQEAARHAQVTLVTKPQWAPLVERFCPEVGLLPFEAPWTAFTGKYRLTSWPWPTLRSLVKRLRAEKFDLGISARFDPRDHVLLLLSGARRRIGLPRLASGVILHDQIPRGRDIARAEAWRQSAKRVNWKLPTPTGQRMCPVGPRQTVILHSGAARPTRIWPVEKYAELVRRLRQQGRDVRLICDPNQVARWHELGEPHPMTLTDIGALIDTLADADRFIGNDSGPGHVAALCGVPTFTIFGPQLPALFTPAHPHSAWIEGRPCRYKPCFDTCRFLEPRCIRDLDLDEVWLPLASWLTTSARG